MLPNVINLSAELEAREHRRKLTPKQEMTIRLRGYYSKQTHLLKSLRFHKLAHKARMREYIELKGRIELQEKKLYPSE